MAKVELPSWITEIRGKMGNVVFRTSPSGEIYIMAVSDNLKGNDLLSGK